MRQSKVKQRNLKAVANRRATVPEIADQNLPATRAEPHAHTASGRNIIGFWAGPNVLS